jgi:hypothetical protein
MVTCLTAEGVKAARKAMAAAGLVTYYQPPQWTEAEREGARPDPHPGPVENGR